MGSTIWQTVRTLVFKDLISLFFVIIWLTLSAFAFCSRKATQVPTDLEDLPKEELVRLLRSVASEREIFERSNNSASATSRNNDDGGGRGENSGYIPNSNKAMASFSPSLPAPKTSATLLPYIPPPPRVKPPPSFKIEQAKARIADTASSLIKKKAHNWKGRPCTDVTEEIPNLEAARELFKGYKEINKTARSYRWHLTGDQVVEWLDCPKYV